MGVSEQMRMSEQVEMSEWGMSEQVEMSELMHRCTDEEAGGVRTQRSGAVELTRHTLPRQPPVVEVDVGVAISKRILHRQTAKNEA